MNIKVPMYCLDEEKLYIKGSKFDSFLNVPN